MPRVVGAYAFVWVAPEWTCEYPFTVVDTSEGHKLFGHGQSGCCQYQKSGERTVWVRVETPGIDDVKRLFPGCGTCRWCIGPQLQTDVYVRTSIIIEGMDTKLQRTK